MRARRALIPVLAGLLLLAPACTAVNAPDPIPVPTRTVAALDVSGVVGISLPASEDPVWEITGARLTEILEGWGVEVVLEYAGSASAQAQDVEAMVADGVNLVLIGAVDDEPMIEPVAAAEEAGIPVVSYDRMLWDTPGVDYHVGFDRFEIAADAGNAALQGIGVTDAEGGRTGVVPPVPAAVEIFTGDMTDPAYFFGYNGLVRGSLEFAAADGLISIPSGHTSPEQTETVAPFDEAAQERMVELLETVYADGAPLAAVATVGDDIALGVVAALRGAGYSPGDDRWPAVTGVGGSLEAVRAVQRGELFATVLRDERVLQETAAYAVAGILSGEFPEDLTTTGWGYESGVGTVPTFLVPGVSVTAATLEDAVLRSGYYTQAQLGG